jgi:hypothetical protein
MDVVVLIVLENKARSKRKVKAKLSEVRMNEINEASEWLLLRKLLHAPRIPTSAVTADEFLLLLFRAEVRFCNAKHQTRPTKIKI